MFVISCEDKKPDEIETVLDWKNLNLAEDWQTGKINVEGIDTESLEKGINHVKSFSGFYSMAIVYKGRMVVEDYKNGNRIVNIQFGL